MKGKLMLSPNQRQIIMDRAFAKEALDTRSEEYQHLQQVRQDYPYYSVVRRRIKRNALRETYDGLTYTYMENYIRSHESGEAQEMVLSEFYEMRLISECHKKSRRYPAIKKWFLTKYPEIKEFGMPESGRNKAADISVTEYGSMEELMPPLIVQPETAA